MTNGEFTTPDPSDYDAQFEAYRAAISDIFDETGLSIDDILDDEETFERVSQQVQERLGAAGMCGLDADSLMLIELITSLEEGGDDGLAGDREPRVTPPTPDIGSIALKLDL